MSAQDFSIPGGVVDMARSQVGEADWLLFRAVVLHGSEADRSDRWSKYVGDAWQDTDEPLASKDDLRAASRGGAIWINLDDLFEEARRSFGGCVVYVALFWSREGTCRATLVAGHRYQAVDKIELVRDRMGGPAFLLPTDRGPYEHVDENFAAFRQPQRDDDEIPTWTYRCWGCWLAHVMMLSCKGDSFLFRGDRRRCRTLRSRIANDAGPALEDRTERMLRMFARVGGKRASGDLNSAADHDRLWSVGQHHGLITPLLDWTESGFLAAFFALAEHCPECKLSDGPDGDGVCEEHQGVLVRNPVAVDPPNGQQDGGTACEECPLRTESWMPDSPGRVVWVLDRGLLPTVKDSQRDVPRIELFESVEPDNARMIAQHGVFTMVQGGMPVDFWAREYGPRADTKGLPVLRKLVYTGHDRRNALRFLNRMNINHATLFPDLEGACWYCNMALEIDDYAPEFPPDRGAAGR